MRSRLRLAVVVASFVFFLPRPASAGEGWDAFMAWLSQLDPGPTWGGGVEVEFCDSPSLLCHKTLRGDERVAVRFHAAYLAGANNESPSGTAQIFQLGSTVEYERSGFAVGGGGGWMFIGGLNEPSVNKLYLNLRASTSLAAIPQLFGKPLAESSSLRRLAIRPEVYNIPTGFKVGEVGNAHEKTNEWVGSVSIVIKLGNVK